MEGANQKIEISAQPALRLCLFCSKPLEAYEFKWCDRCEETKDEYDDEGERFDE